MNLTQNPKNVKWKSEKYREFLRDSMCKFCGDILCGYNPKYIAHHHRHSGGKNPADGLLTRLCLSCHNRLHANEAEFNKKHNMGEHAWLLECMGNLSEYVESLNINSMWVIVNALTLVAQENEKENAWISIV